MVGCAAAHRRVARRVAGMLGYGVDRSDADFAELGRVLPFVRLIPLSDAPPESTPPAG
jgi:hypothetical protein